MPHTPIALRAASIALAAALTAASLLGIDLIAAEHYGSAAVAHQKQADGARLAVGTACRNQG